MKSMVRKNAYPPRSFQWLGASTIVLSTILSSYRFLMPGLSIGDLLTIGTISLGFLFSKQKAPRSAHLVFFCGALAFFHLAYANINTDVNPSSYFRLSKILTLLTFLICTVPLIEKKYISKVFSAFISINVAIVILQHMILIFTGEVVLFLIPGLPLVNDMVSVETIHRVMSADFRPSGLYMEPAHLSYFLFFSCLYMKVFAFNEYNGTIALAILGMVLTFSSFGFFGAILMLTLTALRPNKIFGKVLICVLIIAASLIIVLKQDVFLSIPQLARLLEPESAAIYGRLFAGQSMADNLYSDFPWWGLGFGNFYIEGNINAYYYLILSLGYCGLLAIILIIIFAGRKEHFFLTYKLFLISTMFFSGLLLTHFMILCFLPALSHGLRMPGSSNLASE